VDCDRVMVFPQGNFSVEAMEVLNSRNFDGAVNTTPTPMHEAVRLSLGEIAQPAVLRYGGFPLFLRKDSLHTQSADIAFNCFFGKPVLIVEHHDVFQHPELVAEVATRINKVVPNIHWSNVGTILRKSVLQMSTPDGVRHIRAYSRAVRIANESDSVKRYVIEWKRPIQQGVLSEQVRQDGAPCMNFTADSTGIRLSVDVPARSAQTFSVVRQNSHADIGSLGFGHKAKAFVRRRLSEVRDNYLSKSPGVLNAAKTLQRRLPL